MMNSRNTGPLPLKYYARKGHGVTEALEVLGVLSTQAAHPHQGVVCKNYYGDLDSDYIP